MCANPLAQEIEESLSKFSQLRDKAGVWHISSRIGDGAKEHMRQKRHHQLTPQHQLVHHTCRVTTGSPGHKGTSGATGFEGNDIWTSHQLAKADRSPISTVPIIQFADQPWSTLPTLLQLLEVVFRVHPTRRLHDEGKNLREEIGLAVLGKWLCVTCCILQPEIWFAVRWEKMINPLQTPLLNQGFWGSRAFDPVCTTWYHLCAP